MKTMNRRTFAASALAAAVLVKPGAHVLGANDRVGVGVIGVGGRGSYLLQMALRRASDKEDIEVRAVCDVYQKRLQEAKRKTGGARDFLQHEELLDLPGIDAVMIATPDHWHAPITLAALNKGKDVYVEKPMTHTVEEAKTVYHAVQGSGRVLQVGVQATSWSKWYKAKKAIDDGLLGKVVCCQGTYSRNAPGGDWNWDIDPNAGPDGKGDNYIDWEKWLGPATQRPFDPDRFFRFRKYWDYSGGIATDLHFHTVAPFHLAVRNEHPTRVVGMGGIWVHHDERETPDTFLTAADYPSQFSLTVQSSQANSVGLRTLIRGEHATMFCGADWEGDSDGKLHIVPEPPFKDDFNQRWGKDEIIIEGADDEGDMKHVDNFFDCVRSRTTPNCPVEMGYKVMTTIMLSVQSYRDGVMYYFDADKEKVLSHKPKST